MSADLRARWRQLLSAPPPEVIAARQRLTDRAKRVAATLGGGVPASMDVVVAGSSFLSLYYLGVQSVLTQLEVAGRTRVERYAGASSGAQTPFQVLLTGEDSTVDCHLCYGLLCQEEQAGTARALWMMDVLWRELTDVMFAEPHVSHLHRLDGRMFVSVTHWGSGWKGVCNRNYSSFSGNPTLAREAFYATGAPLTKCNGYWSSDGGVTNNEPKFTADRPQLRPQLIVRPMKAGLPLRCAVQYTLEEGMRMIEKGQDDAARLFDEARVESLPSLNLSRTS